MGHLSVLDWWDCLVVERLYLMGGSQGSYLADL